VKTLNCFFIFGGMSYRAAAGSSAVGHAVSKDQSPHFFAAPEPPLGAISGWSNRSNTESLKS
jgi:hypothetical protein